MRHAAQLLSGGLHAALNSDDQLGGAWNPRHG